MSSVGVAGALLAGGQSRRMGRDKAMLQWRGRTWAALMADTLAGAGCDPVVQIGGSPATGVRCVPDRYPGEGPLGGVLTALDALEGRFVAVVACDLPLLTSITVERLRRCLDDGPGLHVAVADSGRIEPLCAVWRTSTVRSLIEERWCQGERSLMGVLGDLRVGCVPVPPEELLNANTPEDLARASNVAAMAEEITVEQLSDLLARGVTLIDVREPDEYERGHAPGAVLMPLGSVLGGDVSIAGPGPVYMICRSGARSMRACEHLAQQGVDAINVAGGTMAWMASGFDVVEGMEPG
jgi:molybdopterin-guanine dinucleotide biosynthesis protein A